MKTELILKSDVLDIVFDNRNKDYGAYNLRKFYNNRLMKSVGITMALVIVLSAFTFIPKKKTVIDTGDYFPVVVASILPEPKEKIKPAEKPKELQQPKQKLATQIWSTPVIAKPLEPVKPLEGLSDSAVISAITQKGAPGARPVILEPGTVVTGGKGPGTEPAAPIIDVAAPRETAEIMPSYPGGMDALRKFLQRNLSNPKEMEEGEEVSVKIKFVVGYDGKLQSFITVQDGGEEFNKEVIRVLKKMPSWEPGKSNGQNVAVYYTIPVKFVSAN
jgi:protein TonB